MRETTDDVPDTEYTTQSSGLGEVSVATLACVWILMSSLDTAEIMADPDCKDGSHLRTGGDFPPTSLER